MITEIETEALMERAEENLEETEILEEAIPVIVLQEDKVLQDIPAEAIPEEQEEADLAQEAQEVLEISGAEDKSETRSYTLCHFCENKRANKKFASNKNKKFS